jgi:hypothetical protein
MAVPLFQTDVRLRTAPNEATIGHGSEYLGIPRVRYQPSARVGAPCVVPSHDCEHVEVHRLQCLGLLAARS